MTREAGFRFQADEIQQQLQFVERGTYFILSEGCYSVTGGL